MKPLVVAIIVLFAMDCALLYMNVSLRRDIRDLLSNVQSTSSSVEAVQDKLETVIEPRDDQSSAKKTSRQTASSHGRRTHSMAETAIEVLIQRTVAEGVEAAKSGQDELHDFLQKTRPSTKQLFDMVRQENNRLAAINNEKWTPGYMEKKEREKQEREKLRDDVFDYIRQIDTEKLTKGMQKVWKEYVNELDALRNDYDNPDIDYKELNARIERLSYLGGGLYLELRGLLIPNGYFDEKHQLHGCGQSLMNLAQ